MTRPDPVRVLAVGDSYMPAGVFSAALAGLGDSVCVTELQLGATRAPCGRRSSPMCWACQCTCPR